MRFRLAMKLGKLTYFGGGDYRATTYDAAARRDLDPERPEAQASTPVAPGTRSPF